MLTDGHKTTKPFLTPKENLNFYNFVSYIIIC